MTGSSTSWLIAIASAALAVRLAFSFGYWVGKPQTLDSLEYLVLADQLRAGSGYTYPPSSAPAQGRPLEAGDIPASRHFDRPPLYPLFLSVIRRIGGRRLGPIKLVQALLGALNVLSIGLLARRLFGPRAGVWAATIATIYLPFVLYGAIVLSETLAQFLWLAAMHAALDLRGSAPPPDGVPKGTRGGAARSSRGRPLIRFGLASGLAILCRPDSVFVCAALGIWALAMDRRFLRVLAPAFSLTVLVVLPWTARNFRVHGRFVPVAAEGGVTFWTSNNPLATGDGDLAANPSVKYEWLRLEQRFASLSLADKDRAYYREALAFIASHPIRFLWLECRKLFYLFVPIGPSMWVFSLRHRLASYLAYAPLALIAGVGLWRWGASERRAAAFAIPLACALGAVTACLVFYPQERFRIPVIDPVLIVAAAYALVTLAEATLTIAAALTGRGHETAVRRLSRP